MAPMPGVANSLSHISLIVGIAAVINLAGDSTVAVGGEIRRVSMLFTDVRDWNRRQVHRRRHLFFLERAVGGRPARTFCVHGSPRMSRRIETPERAVGRRGTAGLAHALRN
jgi:hypothetical protein